MKKTTGIIACAILTVTAAFSADEIEGAGNKPIPQQEIIQAALLGKTDIINHALAGGYKVDTLDEEGRSLLMYAAFNGQTNVIRKLLDAGADVNAQDKTGSTALMFAASGPFAPAVQLLLDHGAKINAVDNNEHWSALMWAAAEGQTEVVELLLKNGADASLKEADGDTAESFAAKNGHKAVVNILKASATNTPTQSVE